MAGAVVNGIFKTIMVVKGMFDTYKANEKEKKRVLDRLTQLTKPIEFLQENTEQAKKKFATLKRLQAALDAYQSFLQSQVKKKKFSSFLSSSKIRKKFEELEKNMDQCVNDLGFELNVHTNVKVTEAVENIKNVNENVIETHDEIKEMKMMLMQFMIHSQQEWSNPSENFYIPKNEKFQKKKKSKFKEKDKYTPKFFIDKFGLDKKSAQILFNIFDIGRKGSMSRQEFQQRREIIEKGSVQDKASFVFKSWDLDKNGFLDIDEVKFALENAYTLLASFSFSQNYGSLGDYIDSLDKAKKKQFKNEFKSKVKDTMKRNEVEKYIYIMFEQAIKNEDDEISLEEFVKYCEKPNNATFTFLNALSETMNSFLEDSPDEFMRGVPEKLETQKKDLFLKKKRSFIQKEKLKRQETDEYDKFLPLPFPPMSTSINFSNYQSGLKSSQSQDFKSQFGDSRGVKEYYYPNILLLASDDREEYLSDVENSIKSNGKCVVTRIDGSSYIPELDELLNFNIIFLYADYDWLDNKELSENLKNYIESGGKLIICSAFALSSDFPNKDIIGSILNYIPLSKGSLTRSESAKIDSKFKHKILEGVNYFDGGNASFRIKTSNVNGGEILVKWDDGTPLITQKTVLGQGGKNGNVIVLNMFPCSTNTLSSGWDSKSNGQRLISNTIYHLFYSPKTDYILPQPRKIPNVLVVASDDREMFLSDIKSSIQTNGTCNITIFNGVTSTPSIQELNKYDVVFLYSDYDWADHRILSNNLKAFVEGGGKIVMCSAFTLSSEHPNKDLVGNFISLVPFSKGPISLDGPAYLDKTYKHKILEGVKYFDGGRASFRIKNHEINGGEIIARWNDGYPLIVQKQIPGYQDKDGLIMVLNMFPCSTDALEIGWNSESDGGALIANSIEYAFEYQPHPSFKETGFSRANILILASDDRDVFLSDVKSSIQTNGNCIVTTFNARTSTPIVQDLKIYDVVFLYSDFDWADNLSISNNLKTFIESGGKLVMCSAFTLSNEFLNKDLVGEFTSMIPLSKGTVSIDGPVYLDKNDHPILEGVNSFDGGNAPFRIKTNEVNGGEILAKWSDGTPLITKKVIRGYQGKSGMIMVLNMFPCSDNVLGSGGWNSQTDGGKLISNAIKHAFF
ncbi:t9ss type a sorting domain-containing protein [Anaeramoeba ignava]|uniref:T9ss type a sorting domain-containing protein n=1 Tax=Anaeramoeba ignava TaxID=1746090 RepID=A0A9Q0L8C1_ANAIG|nr:t9ss type a sorting domain-containing protein [Anaeramoeba ignava]